MQFQILYLQVVHFQEGNLTGSDFQLTEMAENKVDFLSQIETRICICICICIWEHLAENKVDFYFQCSERQALVLKASGDPIRSPGAHR